jgi:Ca-activated chloride channel family protein
MIEAIDPSGRTPLTASVQIAAAALGAGSRRGVVVLVTDGEENCGADPCALGRTLAARGGLLRVHVVGFRLRVLESSALACLARSTGGTLVEASDTSSLEAALRTTFGCTPMSRKRLGDAHARNAR